MGRVFGNELEQETLIPRAGVPAYAGLECRLLGFQGREMARPTTERQSRVS